MKLSNITILLLFLVCYAKSQNHIILQPGPFDQSDVSISSLDASQTWNDHISFFAKSGTRFGDPVDVRSLLRFDLSKLDKNREIEGAYLELYYAPFDQDNPDHRGYNAALIAPITGNWNFNSVNWNNQPNIDESKAINLPQSNFQFQSYSVDVTELVHRASLSPGSYFGWMFKLQIEQNYADMKFASANSPDPNLRPKLTVVYGGKITETHDLLNKNGFTYILSNGILNLTFADEKFTELSLVGLDGRCFYKASIKGLKYSEVNLNDIPKGIYFSILTGSNELKSFKILN